ncbi:hypothetical protein C882_2930 [Caenispirillum salinarum AK4]|uniref:Trypsin-co-occurring domain-containing protein n=2 Tax=Caenispirillum TaxID=414051 RepID=K9GM95_9PROT|nr:hypothetical protein C882_2930 [Caenispirillum salinarum AK4]
MGGFLEDQRKMCPSDKSLGLRPETVKLTAKAVAKRTVDGGVEFQLVTLPIGGGASAATERSGVQTFEMTFNVPTQGPGGALLSAPLEEVGRDEKCQAVMDQRRGLKTTAPLAYAILDVRQAVLSGLDSADGPQLSPQTMKATFGVTAVERQEGRAGIDILVFSVGGGGSHSTSNGQTMEISFTKPAEDAEDAAPAGS